MKMAKSHRKPRSTPLAVPIVSLAVSFTIAMALPTEAAKSKKKGGAQVADDPGCRSCIANAAALFAQGKNKEAAQLLREWAPKCPNSSQLHLMLSTVLLRVGADIAEVEATARSAVAADEHSIAARLQLALVLTNNNKTAEGIEQLKKVTELDPANYEAWSSLAAAYKVLRKDDLASQAAGTAAELEPNTMQVRLSVLRNLRKTGKLDAAKTELKKLLSGKNTSPVLMQELAQEALLIGDYEDAITCAKNVLSKFAKSVPALKMMALANYCQADYAASLAVANQLLESDKENPDGLAMKGLALLKLNRAGEAEAPVSAALSRQPDSSLALLGSGALQATKGNTDSAIDQLVQVLDADASSAQSQGLPEPLAHLELAAIYQKLGRASAASDEARAAAHDGRFSKQAQHYIK
jgi:predicted Zn-dependent protease